ncbi:hypothetical protein ACEWY4_027969 [Coilia grayii]|uniref:Replication factor A C-terminal domain-containing protein n=1 Tax=Coilia grayii TaxID=363190 RepID=A0ABD1IQG4_9TELE
MKMATHSPTKRKPEEDPITGYLHEVSPVKTSWRNVSYFDATMQTDQGDYKRVVCFSPEKRAAFQQATDNKQSVKLINAQKTISSSNPGTFDVLVSSRSSVEAAEQLSFPWREPRTTEKVSIADVLALGPRQRVGAIEARVLQATANRVVPLNGVPSELRMFEICDPTGQTALTLWDRQILSVQEGKSYRFAALSTRKEGDRTVLTGSPQTAITAVGDVGQPPSVKMPAVAGDETVVGQVTGVQIVVKPRCRRCHAGQESVAARSTTHRCERCGILQHTNAYVFTYSGVFILVTRNGEELSLTLTNSAVFNYVRDNYLARMAHDGPSLEEEVMGLSELEATVNGEGLIVRFGPGVPAEVSGSAKQERAGGRGRDLRAGRVVFAECDDTNT